MFGLTLITAPVSEPVSVDTLKAHLHINLPDEDTLLASYITSARQTFENLSGLALLPQTWRLTLDAWQQVVLLPRPPLQSVSWVNYWDATEAQQTLPLANYTVDTQSTPARLHLHKAYPSSQSSTILPRLEVQYVAGYAEGFQVPAQIKLAIMLLAGTFYGNREHLTEKPLAELPMGFQSIVNQYKVGRL